MNKKYLIKENGKVTIVTDDGDIIEREEKYTKNTGKILSLENTVESIENKINLFKKELRRLETEKKISKSLLISIAIALLISIATTLLVLIGITLLIPKSPMLGVLKILLSCFSIGGIITGIPGIVTLVKNKKRAAKLTKKIPELSHEKKKTEKMIANLSQDKTKLEPIDKNTFIDVEPAYTYNFDSSDYFITKYQIAKRTEEMSSSRSKKRTRKLERKRNNINREYEV